MGLEGKVRAKRGKKSLEGKAHLDRDKLDFTSPGASFHVPFKDMSDVAAVDGELRFRWNGEAVSLALGKDAAKWAAKIVSPKGRLDKLGVKPGARVTVLGVRDADFRRELAGRAEVQEKLERREQDVIFLAVSSPDDLERLKPLLTHLDRAGAIWVVRKKGKEATVSEQEVRDAAKDAGLVDVKVVSFSDTHTAEKLVIPISRRT